MKYFSQETRELVADSLKQHNGDQKKVASLMGLSMNEVNWIDIVHNKRFNYTDEGMGRRDLRPWLIAHRDRFRTSGWDNNEPKIAKARELYDAGLVEMIHGFDGVNILLYAIPRRFPEVERAPYFTIIEEEEVINVQ